MSFMLQNIHLRTNSFYYEWQCLHTRAIKCNANKITVKIDAWRRFAQLDWLTEILIMCVWSKRPKEYITISFDGRNVCFKEGVTNNERTLRNNTHLPISVYTSFPPPTLFESPRDVVVVVDILRVGRKTTQTPALNIIIIIYRVALLSKRAFTNYRDCICICVRLIILNTTYPDWCKTPVNWYRMSISSGVIWLMICEERSNSSLVTGSLRWPPVAFRYTRLISSMLFSSELNAMK